MWSKYVETGTCAADNLEISVKKAEHMRDKRFLVPKMQKQIKTSAKKCKIILPALGSWTPRVTNLKKYLVLSPAQIPD